MAAQIKITNIRLDKTTQTMRVDIQFKASMRVEKAPDAPSANRILSAQETHWFIMTLPAEKETSVNHRMPSAWAQDLQDLFVKLEEGMADYII